MTNKFQIRYRDSFFRPVAQAHATASDFEQLVHECVNGMVAQRDFWAADVVAANMFLFRVQLLANRECLLPTLLDPRPALKRIPKKSQPNPTQLSLFAL